MWQNLAKSGHTAHSVLKYFDETVGSGSSKKKCRSKMSKKFGEIFGVSDFKSRIGIRNLVRSVAAEFFGTFFIVFFGCAINLGTQEVDLVRVR